MTGECDDSLSDQSFLRRVLDKVRAANQSAGRRRCAARRHRPVAVVVEPPREPAHGDLATNAAMVLAKTPARSRATSPTRIAARLRADALVAKVDVAGPGFINLTLEAAGLDRSAARAIRGGRRLRAGRIGQGRDGQRRIRLGQSDRADACRPLPRRRVRRRAGEPARLRRLRGHARILHQRCRRPGRCARALGLSCATARRSARTSAPIPEGLYPGDYLKPVGEALAARAWRTTLLDKPESEWLPIVRAEGDRHDDGR